MSATHPTFDLPGGYRVQVRPILGDPTLYVTPPGWAGPAGSFYAGTIAGMADDSAGLWLSFGDRVAIQGAALAALIGAARAVLAIQGQE